MFTLPFFEKIQSSVQHIVMRSRNGALFGVTEIQKVEILSWDIYRRSKTKALPHHRVLLLLQNMPIFFNELLSQIYLLDN